MIAGCATFNGTNKYMKKFDLPTQNASMFIASPIGIGTHLGEMNVQDSEKYREGIEFALQNGINFVDTAINYRGMRSERDVGYVLKKLIQEKQVLKRNEIIISTKAGIIPGDVTKNLVPKVYLKKVLYKNNIIKESDLNIVENHRHVLTPNYYQFAIQESKKHLNIETIDIYYVHNPEISMMVLGAEEFYKQLEKLFSFLEEQVKFGHIKFYGFATWFGVLHNPDENGYISIEDVISTAKVVAGEDHHFKFIQFPLNKQINMGSEKANQKVNNNWLTVLNAAKELGIYSITSAPFNLGRAIDEGDTPQKSLRDLTSNNGIFSTMVGMKQINHIKNNIQVIS